MAVAGEVTPEFWSFEVSHDATPGLCDLMGGAARPITIADLRRSSLVRTNEDGRCALLLVRQGQATELPADTEPILVGDKLLFAGTRSGRVDQRNVVRNATVAGYVIAGRGSLDGTVWQWLSKKLSPTAARASSK